MLDLYINNRFCINKYSFIIWVDFKVTDPKHFTMPWSATQYYAPGRTPWDEIICAENNRDARTGVEYEGVPIAAKLDF